MKVRGGSREMDMMFKDAGASVLSLPSNEIYAAMQTGAMDAALTSSTSLISFRLEEVSKFLTSGRGKSYWFMFEPLMMSKQIFDKLPKAQQDAIMAVGADLEKFAVDSAKADDIAVADVYAKTGAKVSDLDDATLKKWQALAQPGVEGLRRQERELREAAGAGREAAVRAAGPGGAPAGTAVTHGVDLPGAPGGKLAVARRRAAIARGALNRVNRAISFVGMIALLAASFVLTYSVFSRYLFKAGTDWQDEVAVFCIVGAVFLSGAWVQAQRGHVGIEAMASILAGASTASGVVLVDIMTLAFCAFFAWKSWTLFHEAWVDKMTTSSTFSPPLTIPYGLMAAGMTLLVLQLAAADRRPFRAGTPGGADA